MSSQRVAVPHRRPERRLSRTIGAALLALAVIAVLALTTIPLLTASSAARADRQADLEAVGAAANKSLIGWLDATRARLGRWAGYPGIRSLLIELTSDVPVSDDAEQRFAGYTGLLSPFDVVLVLDAQGAVRAASDPRWSGSSLHSEAWFAATLEEAAPGYVMLHGPLPDPLDGQESLYFSFAVYDNTGALSGVLVARTSLMPLQSTLDALPVWGQTGDLFLIGADRQFVTQPHVDTDREGARDEAIDRAIGGMSGSGTWTDYRMQEVIGSYYWVAPLNMALIAKQDVAEVAAGASSARRALLVAAVLVALIAGALAVIIPRRVGRTLEEVGAAAARIASGDLSARLPETRYAEVTRLATVLNQMADRLQVALNEQERIAQGRARQLEIASRMGRMIVAETDLDRLLQTTIDLIRDRLGYYHVQVFMLDDLRQNAVLRASMGSAGREMLARGHKLGVGSHSVVGQTTARGEPVLASDTRHAEFWRPNPLLPETRAEVAVPLRVAGQVIGALDVQSTATDAFDEPTISVLEAIADQLSVAIQNAQLFHEKEGLLSASVQLTQMLTRDSWEMYLAQRRADGIGYAYDLSQVRPADQAVGGDSGELSVPIELRGSVIGELSAELGGERALTDEEKQLVQQVLERMALAIDNVRLVEQTQHSLMQADRLYKSTHAVASARSPEELADGICGAVLQFTSADRTSMLLLETPTQEIGGHQVSVVSLRLRDENDPFGRTPRRFVLEDHPLFSRIASLSGDALIINNVYIAGDLDDETRARLKEAGVQAVASFPILPAFTGGRTLGWLIMQSTRAPDAFSEADLLYFETLADQAATALEGLRLFEQTQNRARRLQATNEVSRAASSVLNPDVLLPMVVERVSEAFGYYHVQIFLVDRAREWAVLRASTGDVGQELLRRGHRLAVGSRSVIGQVTATGEPLIARDTDSDPVHRRNELLPNTRSEMAIPLIAGERVIGALDIQSTQPEAFDEEAQAILRSLADQIAVTLENAQLFQEIQERVAELTTVNLVSQTISRAETMEDVYGVVSSQLMRQFGSQYGFLGVLDREGLLHLPIFIEAGELLEPPPPQPVGQGLSGHVITTRRVLVINENAEEEARRLGARVVGSFPRSVLIAPLLLGDEVVGVISIQDVDREHAYGEAHVRQLTTLAAYLAVKIRNAQLLEEAQRRADELGFLFDVTRAAVASSDLREALTSVGEIFLREIEGAEAVVIYLEADQDTYQAQAAVGYGRDLLARQVSAVRGEGLIGMAADQRTALIVEDTQTEAYHYNGSSRTRSALVVPLVAGDVLLGMLTVESSRPRTFGSDDLRLLEGAAGTLAAVVQNARLLEQITQANKQLRELDKLKSQFLANMSHELRTPLNSIIGFSRVILKGIDGPLTDLQAQDLNTIYSSGQHLLGLINNILDLSKIEAGKMEIQPDYINLYDTLETVIATGRGLLKDRPIEFIEEIPANLPRVYADPVRVRQVLLNLISNAAKFTHEGHIILRAAAHPYNLASGEPSHVQIDVIDTGIGISQEDMGRLFEPFSQVDGSTTRQAGGTGLGLTISKEFVEMHGGRIWVQSEPGHGSTFSFTIPLTPPGVRAADVVLSAGEESGRPLVLCVDDEPGVLDLYARYLEKEGYAVVGLNNANDLVERARGVRPAAIVLDVNLPGKTGWDALNDLKQDAETRGIPVVIASIEDDREHGQRIGANEYLVKPIMGEDLVGALARVMYSGAAPLRDVVIIDSDQAYAAALGEALHSAYGCSVRMCRTGVDGLEAILSQRPDAVVMELDLPDMDGYGLLVSMRSQGTLHDIPVIILTARELPAEQLDLLGRQATFYVNKQSVEGQRLVEAPPAVLDGLGLYGQHT